MSAAYVNAPATRMLASQCSACGQPLVDSKSVNLGIGPDCRKKYGFDMNVPEEARSEANRLVHWIAVHQDDAGVRERVIRLYELGFDKLAARVAKRIGGCVRIEQVGDFLHVRTPYNAEHVERMRRVPGRRCLKDDNNKWFDRVPVQFKRELWNALCASFGGKLGIGSQGMFVIGGAS